MGANASLGRGIVYDISTLFEVNHGENKNWKNE